MNIIKQTLITLTLILTVSISGFAVRDYLDLPLILRPAVTSEGELQLSGGYEQGRHLSRFTLAGSGIFAAKTRGGLFLQGAGMAVIAGDYKECGVSAGFGYEPGQVGLFLFGDGLLVKEGSLPPDMHLQIRPALRLKTNFLSGSLFYAKTIASDCFLLRQRVENGVRFGLFREAVDHLGLDLTLRLGRLLVVEGRGVIGEQLLQVEASAGVHMMKNLYLTAGYAYTHTSGAIRGMGNHSRLFASITVGAGVRSKFKDLERRIIMRPDYPIVRTIEKELEKDSTPPLAVSLSAAPTRGPAPLDVNFHAQPGGGSAPYATQWTIASAIDSSLDGMNPSTIFTAPGNYNVAVVITDAEGRRASSNTVTITVDPPSGEQSFTIVASSGPGGSIDPAGAITVNRGENRLFFMKPDANHRVKRVIVDGSPVGAPSSYTFEAISAHHTIHVEFATVLSRCFKIVASSTNGGFISPEGSVPVEEGSEASFAIAPQTGFKVKQVTVDGADKGILTSYRFQQIYADHYIHAVFEPHTFIVTATASCGGAVNPPGATTVSAGQSLTVNIQPDAGFDIASVTVDGKPAGAVFSYTFSTIDANHTLHAEFSETPVPSFTITATCGPGGAISPAGDVDVPSQTDATFAIRPKAGFRIESLVVDNASVAPTDEYTFTSVTADHVIHAGFTPVTYTVTASSGPGGTVDPTGATTVNQGDNLTIAIDPDPATIIQNVIVDGTSVGAVPTYTFASINADHSLTATFKKKTFPVTASAGPGGGIDPSGAIIANYGDTMTFAITPATGYSVEDIIVDNISNGPLQSYTFPDIRGPHAIEARFKLNTFTIQSISGPGGSIRPSGLVTVNYGESKTFNAQSSDPLVYELETVIIDGQSQGPIPTYTFRNITADHTIRAAWKHRRYRIDASSGAGGAIAPSGTTYYDAAATPTFTAVPDAGYEIDRVIIDGSYNAGSTPIYTFDPLYSDHTIRVLFKKKAYAVLIQKTFSDGSSGTPPNPVDPVGQVAVTHGDTLSITIDNHFQGSDPSSIYSLDYISEDGHTTTYRGTTKSIVIHATAPVTAAQTIICHFYRRTN